MERFGVMFTVLFICMAVLMGFIFQHIRALDAVTLSDHVMYTTDVSMPLPGNAATATGVYLNSDLTVCFVMLRWVHPSLLVSVAPQ